MGRIFITGSSDGLGLASARTLLRDGHDVTLHARTPERAAALRHLVPDAAAIVVGDLSSAAETRGIADQVNRIGRMDAVIQNAGVYLLPARGATPEGHATTLAVNSLAPFLLSVLLERPARMIFLSSGLHRGGEGSLKDLDWTERRWDGARAYAESKLHVAAMAFALARRWPNVLSNAVDPGWVRTRMGGPGAPVDLETGQRTQSWLAVGDEPAARASGCYWHHMAVEQPAEEVRDPAFQDQLIDRFQDLTGKALA